jgi:hypothetical protein
VLEKWINRSLLPLIEPPRITFGKVKSYVLISHGKDQSVGGNNGRMRASAGARLTKIWCKTHSCLHEIKIFYLECHDLVQRIHFFLLIMYSGVPSLQPSFFSFF